MLSQSERDKAESQLLNAQAYALFRYGQVRYGKDEAKEFQYDCEEAIRKLWNADALQPKQYIIMQNLGLIYGDPRFDPGGHHIELARRLFEHSLKLKPRDYFGKRHLAALTVRQAYLTDPELITSDIIAKAIEQGEEASKLRGESTMVPILLSELYALRAIQTTDPEEKKKNETRAIVVLRAVEQLHPYQYRVPIAAARLRRQFLRLRTSADGHFEIHKRMFLEELEKIKDIAARIPGWEGENLSRVTASLTKVLKSLEVDYRYSLRWPS